MLYYFETENFCLISYMSRAFEPLTKQLLFDTNSLIYSPFVTLKEKESSNYWYKGTAIFELKKLALLSCDLNRGNKHCSPRTDIPIFVHKALNFMTYHFKLKHKEASDTRRSQFGNTDRSNTLALFSFSSSLPLNESKLCAIWSSLRWPKSGKNCISHFHTAPHTRAQDPRCQFFLRATEAKTETQRKAAFWRLRRFCSANSMSCPCSRKIGHKEQKCSPCCKGRLFINFHSHFLRLALKKRKSKTHDKF